MISEGGGLVGGGERERGGGGGPEVHLVGEGLFTSQTERSPGPCAESTNKGVN